MSRHYLALAMLAAFASGCPLPCTTTLPAQPPRDPSCDTIDFYVHLGAFPDTGDLAPDYLVASGTTVNAVAVAVEEMVCHSDRGQPDDSLVHVNRRPDFSWKLEFIPRGGIKTEVTQSQLAPPAACLDPTFVATRGTWRLTFWLTQQPTFAQTITVEAADPDEWLSIGPDGRTDGVNDYTGRLDAIAFDPNQPGVMYVASAGGGIFRSDGDGDFWYPMSDHKIVDGQSKQWMAGLGTGGVIVLPNSHLVAATCSLQTRALCDKDHLFYRSSDGGVTWMQSGTNCTDPSETDTPTGLVSALVASHRRQEVFAVVGGALYRSRSEGNCWRRITPPTTLLGGRPLVTVALQELRGPRKTSGTNLIVATSDWGNQKVAYTLDKLLFMTLDAEALDPTWVAAKPGLSAAQPLNAINASSVDFAQISATAEAAYVAFALNDGMALYRARTVGIGQAPVWERTKADPPVDGDGNNLAIAVSPFVQNGITLGDEVAVAGRAAGHVVRSTTGGDSWTALGELHADHHFLAFDPVGDRLWDASDGGLAQIDFLMGSWIARPVGLATTQVFDLAISNADPTHAISGVALQDNSVFFRRQRGRVWTYAAGSGCDGLQVSFDAADPSVAYHGDLNCGRGLNRIDLPSNTSTSLGSAQFYHADTYKAGRMRGVDAQNIGVYHSYIADGVDKISGPPLPWRCADPQPAQSSEFVTSVLALAAQPELYYVADAAGDVYSVDATRIVGNPTCNTGDTTGVAVYTSQPSPKASVVQLASDPADKQSIYLTQARTDAERVVHLLFDSQSNTWTPAPLAQQFPSTPYGSFLTLWSVGFIAPIVADPLSPSTVLVGSELGLSSGSATPNSAWSAVATVPNTWVTRVVTADGPRCDGDGIVRAATLGRSVWQRFFPSSTFQSCPPPTPSPRPWARVRPDGGEGWIEPSSRAHVGVDYVMPDGAPGRATLRVTPLRHGEPSRQLPPVSVDVKGPRGTRIVELSLVGDADGVVATEALLTELVAGEKVIASATERLPLEFRADGRRLLRVTTSLLRGGGSSPLPGVEVRVGQVSFRTPGSIALPRGQRVVLEAPPTMALPDKRTATFAGWIGSTHRFSDWSRRRPIPASSAARRMELSLDADADIDLRYRPPVVEREEAVESRGR